MRFIIIFVVASVGVAACGGSVNQNNDDPTPLPNGCPSQVAGSWKGTTQDDELILGDDGSFRYSGFDGCTNTGTFACAEPNLSPGTMEVSVSASSGGYCLPVATHTCDFTLNRNSIGYDCSGEGALYYQRS